jgi:DnaK suppressor protein
MLSEKEKAYFEKVLKQQLAALLAEASKSVDGLTEPKDESPDIVEQASIEYDRDFLLRIRERERKLITKIRDALQRLEQGHFGICENCGREISEDRLRARPVATLCIKCKKKQEAEEKLRES